ncbi:MAG: hypothetical protein ABIH83_03895 [Candidatus Micrarchaeota archaeon]
MVNRNFIMIIVFGLVFAGLFIGGCIKPAAAGRCDQFVDSYEKDTCLEYMAVWYQDPYTCYEIREIEARERCLESAINPAEATKLQIEERNTQKEVVVKEEKEGQRIFETDVFEDSRVKECMLEQKLSKEGCMHKIAVENNDLILCSLIEIEEYRKPCISQVAINLKDVNACSLLDRNEDEELCKYYASG